MGIMDTINTDWTAEDWAAHYDERAGLREFDGGLGRIMAEALALRDCIGKYRIGYGVSFNEAARALKKMGVGK